jgi:hypothetical protein
MFVKNEEGRWTCPPGETAAAEQGLGFAVFVMKKSEVQLSNNLEFLADYHDKPKGNYFPDIAQHIRKIVREKPGMQIRDIQDEIGEDGADTLFFMIARREGEQMDFRSMAVSRHRQTQDCNFRILPGGGRQELGRREEYQARDQAR